MFIMTIDTGAASPQAVKKLLSLSEQSRPRQKCHPGESNSSVVSAPAKPETGTTSAKVDRADQHTPVNLTSESSSVTVRQAKEKSGTDQSQCSATIMRLTSDQSESGKMRVRKMQNSIGSVTSTDSGYGQSQERYHSESPQLPPRQRRYHQHHFHRPHHHGNNCHQLCYCTGSRYKIFTILCKPVL